MRIIIIGTAYPWRGGISHYNTLLYRELSKRHEVSVITFRRQYPALLFPGKTQMESEGEIIQVPTDAWVDSLNPFNWIKVGRRIRERKPDLLIFRYWLPFFGPCFGTIARVAKRGTSSKVLFICDNIIPHERRPGDNLFTRYAFKPVDSFIVQSDAVERDLGKFRARARYRKAPHPLYTLFGNAVPKGDARAALGIDGDRILLFFGYVRPYKGLHVLLDAMAVLRSVPGIRALIVGEFYDDQQKYMKQIRSLGLESHVIVKSDYVANEEVKLYFSAADVVVLPYVSATQSGIVQIAYNFDRPVIATDVGGLSEVVHHNVTGFLVPPNDPDALARSIQRFYEEQREEEFTDHVREEKTKYSWERMTEAIEELAAG